MNAPIRLRPTVMTLLLALPAAMAALWIFGAAAWAGELPAALAAQSLTAEKAKREADLKPLLDAGIGLSPWHCIGPFKDAEYGVFGREVATAFGPEKDVIARAALGAELDRVYTSVPVVGMPDPSRHWEIFPDWLDGYYHELPSGPPPARNEVLYLYRTLTAKTAIDVQAYLVTLDAAKGWLNGEPALDAPIREGAGQRFLQAHWVLHLKAGDNRLLLKITKCFQKHGFSFAIDGLHPLHPFLKGQAAQLEKGACRASGNTDFGEALAKVRNFRPEVVPLPSFEPPALKMQEALDLLEPTPDGRRYLARLAPVRDEVAKALAAGEDADEACVAQVFRAAETIDLFRTESIRAAGPIVFVRHPSFGPINAVNPYETDGAGPAGIAVCDPSRPEAAPRVIYDDPAGKVFNLSLSYDGTRVLFSAKRQGVAGGWHVYEIGVDGSDLKQITSGACDDITPVELPSGEILFVSDRNGSFNVCQPNRAGVMLVCKRDGSSLRRVSANTLSDHSPSIMNDGRVMFTRWDYGVDKGVFQRHGVWSMNPDGTHLQLFFGNTVADPNAFWQCTQVPDRPEVVSTFGGHHSGPYGVIGLLWDQLGAEAPRGQGFRWLTPELPTYFDAAFFNGYVDPFPLDENEFLVSYGGAGDNKNRLYLLDNRGNRTCIWEEPGATGCYNPVPLRPRKRPPVIPVHSKPEDGFTPVDPVISGICPDESKTGTLVLNDVYVGLEGRVARGEIKALQIMELVPKTRPHTGGYAYNISPTIGRGTFYVRRLIGTVPVENDGSACFSAPAMRDISFNALDGEGRVIQKMGSSTQLMNGEVTGCTGCHVYQNSPDASSSRMPLAVQRAPSVPQRPDWGTQGIIDYVKVVQPVFDRYCIKCHDGATPKGNLSLSGDKTRYFNLSYDMLIDRGLVHHIPQNGADHDLTTPKATGSLASRILPQLDAEHHGVKLPLEERQKIYTWIDANVPYYHTYLYTDGGVNGARDRWYDDLRTGWFQRGFAPVFQRRCFDCHKRDVDISDAWLGRRSVTVTSKVWSDITLMDQSLQIENSLPIFGPEYRINLTHPEWSQMLTAPLAKRAGGLGLCKDKQGQAIFKDTSEPDYLAMLAALQEGSEVLALNPRVDMLPRPDPAHPEAYVPSITRLRRLPPLKPANLDHPLPLPDIFLDDLALARMQSGNESKQTQLRKNCIGKPLMLGGTTYERGIGDHAGNGFAAELVYALKPEYQRFVAVVGVDDQTGERGSLRIHVYVDGQLQTETPILRGGQTPHGIDVELRQGAGELRLVIDDAGDGYGYDDADFGNAGFVAAGGS
ncbi:MAG: NPCBM/NEW2 domain-containing protein [Verrucomicrobia bacterium]|nr:NPCBM/NEW2 domain-containing protein [Verrucomicrobiota bacterium]